jgi:hypothetical protein
MQEGTRAYKSASALGGRKQKGGKRREKKAVTSCEVGQWYVFLTAQVGKGKGKRWGRETQKRPRETKFWQPDWSRTEVGLEY